MEDKKCGCGGDCGCGKDKNKEEGKECGCC